MDHTGARIIGQALRSSSAYANSQIITSPIWHYTPQDVAPYATRALNMLLEIPSSEVAAIVAYEEGEKSGVRQYHAFVKVNRGGTGRITAGQIPLALEVEDTDTEDFSVSRFIIPKVDSFEGATKALVEAATRLLEDSNAAERYNAIEETVLKLPDNIKSVLQKMENAEDVAQSACDIVVKAVNKKRESQALHEPPTEVLRSILSCWQILNTLVHKTEQAKEFAEETFKEIKVRADFVPGAHISNTFQYVIGMLSAAERLGYHLCQRIDRDRDFLVMEDYYVINECKSLTPKDPELETIYYMNCLEPALCLYAKNIERFLIGAVDAFVHDPLVSRIIQLDPEKVKEEEGEEHDDRIGNRNILNDAVFKLGWGDNHRIVDMILEQDLLDFSQVNSVKDVLTQMEEHYGEGTPWRADFPVIISAKKGAKK